MGSQPNLTPKVVFGPFEYDDLSGRLSKYGIPLRLRGKPLQILSVLLNRPGQIVTRGELQRQLWGDTTFVDFEQGLNSAVNKLRQTLGDSADSPLYVETLPGQGYRFIAPFQHASSKAVLEMVAPPPVRVEPPPARTFVKPILALMAGVALAALAGGAYWLARRSGAAVVLPRMTKLTVSPPSGFALQGSASHQSFALAPDGSRLAFTAVDSTGQSSLFVRDFNSLEARLVPGSEGTGLVFWPPDGRSLYMTVHGRLVRKPDETDAHITLADSPPYLHLGVWLDPNRILLDSAQGSYFVSAAGAMEPLKDTYSWPQLLPDGEHFLYVRWNSRAGHFRARVASLTDFPPPGAIGHEGAARAGETNDLIETDSRVMYTASTGNPDTGYLLYVRGGSLLAQPFDPRTRKITGEAELVVNKVYSFANAGAADFSVASRGSIAYLSYVSRSQLMWVDRTGRQLGGIGPADANVKTGRLSPDGLKVAAGIYDVDKGVQDLWTFDVNTNLGRRLTADPGHRDGAVWSPDSTTLAFLFAADRQLPRVHLRGLGQDVEKAMPADGFQLPTDWSPDGRFVAFVNTAFTRFQNEEQGDVCVLDLSREGKITTLLNSRFNEGNPAFSPDGHWLAFTSNESGRSELYVQAFRSGDSPGVTGDRYLVSRAGALAVRWRRDEREIFYLGFDGRVQAVPVSLSPKPRFGVPVKLFTIATEARAAIHSLPGFDVSADGQRFLIPVVSSVPAPSIVVVHNWESQLTPKPTGRNKMASIW